MRAVQIAELGPVTVRDALEAATRLRRASEALEAARRRLPARRYAELHDYITSAAATVRVALEDVQAGVPVPWAMLQTSQTVTGMTERALGVSLGVERRSDAGHDAATRERTLRLARLREAASQVDAHSEAGRAAQLADMRRSWGG